MRPRKRDSSFLFIAALAASGGLLAIVLSIGLPIVMRSRGHSNISPAFSLFAAWGVAALLGAYACFRTYLLSDDPGRPPRGGVHLRVIGGAEAVASPNEGEIDATRSRAA